jgi:hypothetical protein
MNIRNGSVKSSRIALSLLCTLTYIYIYVEIQKLTRIRIKLTGRSLKVFVGLSTKSSKQVGRGTNLCPFRAVTFLLLRLLTSSTHGYLDKVTTVPLSVYTQPIARGCLICRLDPASILLRSYLGPTRTKPVCLRSTQVHRKSYQHQDTRRTSLLLSPRTIVQRPTNNFSTCLYLQN